MSFDSILAVFSQICICIFIYQVTILAILSFVGFWGVAILYPLPFVTVAPKLIINKILN